MTNLEPRDRVPPGPAGWYPDPGGEPILRWWDGTAWTRNLSANGRTFVETTPDAAVQALNAEPRISYLERVTGYGGHIDLFAADGRPLGWANGVPWSLPSGSTAAIGLFDIDGLRLGTLGPSAAQRMGERTVYAANGVAMGTFRKPKALKTILSVVAGTGAEVARYNYDDKNTYFVSAENHPLAHLRRSSDPRFAGGRDRFWLEPLVPMQSWMFLIALFAPIEANTRLDATRQMWANVGQTY